MNKLIEMVKKEQAEKAEYLEKQKIAKMLDLIKSKDKAIKTLEAEKARLEKELGAGDYSALTALTEPYHWQHGTITYDGNSTTRTSGYLR